MKKIIFTTFAIFISVVLIFTACSKNHFVTTATPTTRKTVNGYTKISQKEAKKLMDTENNLIILDVRTKSEYNEGHIKNAVLLPNEEIGNTLPKELPNKNQLILIYCRSGNRSRQAAEKLIKLGYTNVKDFGGINTWEYDTEN